jgi:hypothetical protein
MIKPETYTQLAEGDMVTFGKAVGKGDDAVPPITARVELHYAAEGETIKPLITTSTSSGHYGLNDQSSSSDESSGNNYSDIEEIASPVQKKQPSFSSSAASALNSVLKLTQRLPPLWLGGDDATDDSVLLPLPRGYNGDQERDEDSVPSLHAGHFVASNEWDNAESCSDSSDEGCFSPRSRSNSPMELASPSPAPVEPVEPPQPATDLALVSVSPPRSILTWPPSSSLRVPPPPLPMLPPFPPMRMFPPGLAPPPPSLTMNVTEPADLPQFTARLAPPPWVLQPKPVGPPPAALLPERPVDHSPQDEAKSLDESDNEDDERSVASSRDAQMEDIDERLYALEVCTLLSICDTSR